jgi:ubiquinone/menaquinone biosynthesis C-methylase UbiE
MIETLKKLNNQFYNETFSKHGEDVRSLGWGSKESQNIRFRVLLEMGIKGGQSVLDVGCGFGDFYDFLLSQNINVDYVGADINKNFIKVAKQKNKSVIFHLSDTSSFSNDSFDWVVASGVFCFDDENNNLNKLTKNLSKLYNISKKAAAVNFLSSETKGNIKEGFRHYKPQNIINAALTITNKVSLRHDYLQNDFTVYLYKE